MGNTNQGQNLASLRPLLERQPKERKQKWMLDNLNDCRKTDLPTPMARLTLFMNDPRDVSSRFSCISGSLLLLSSRSDVVNGTKIEMFSARMPFPIESWRRGSHFCPELQYCYYCTPAVSFYVRNNPPLRRDWNHEENPRPPTKYRTSTATFSLDRASYR